MTTQLLLTLFDVKGVVHYGIAGNTNASMNIGDVTIPKYWSHAALWNWQVIFNLFKHNSRSKHVCVVLKIIIILQRFGDGPEDELSLEANGDYTREIGYLNFADYATNVSNFSSNNNLLNNIWYQPEEIFPVDGVPEQRQHAFWVPINPHYLEISKKLEVVFAIFFINS